MKNLTDILSRLFDLAEERKSADPETSYIAKLFKKGRKKIAQKVGEEGVEVAIAAVQDKKIEIIKESADLLFHLLILWKHAEVSPDEVAEELNRRENTSGLTERKTRPM